MTQTEVDAFEARRLSKLIPKDFGMLPGDPSPSERALHSKIFDECRRLGWIPLHGTMSERTHRTCGEPDFVILADGGRTLFVECKMPNGKLSNEQQAMIAHASKLGHTVHVVRSFTEFLKAIK